MWARVARPRVMVYGAVLVAITAAMLTALWTRVPVKVDVIRDRTSIAREVEGERIENVYRLQAMNTLERPVVLKLSAQGDAALGELEVLSDLEPVVLEPLVTRSFTVRVRAKQGPQRGSRPMEFLLQPAPGETASFKIREKSRFLVP
jgi:polyferredoxin